MYMIHCMTTGPALDASSVSLLKLNGFHSIGRLKEPTNCQGYPTTGEFLTVCWLIYRIGAGRTARSKRCVEQDAAQTKAAARASSHGDCATAKLAARLIFLGSQTHLHAVV